MKGILFASSIMLLALGGCGKKSQPTGTPYTKQVAGTRNYAHVSYRSFNDPTKSPVTVTDTVALSIEYVNDATINIQSYTLVYNSGASSDNKCVYNAVFGDMAPATVKLIYERTANSIDFRIDSYEISTPNYDTYHSL